MKTLGFIFYYAFEAFWWLFGLKEQYDAINSWFKVFAQMGFINLVAAFLPKGKRNADGDIEVDIELCDECRDDFYRELEALRKKYDHNKHSRGRH